MGYQRHAIFKSFTPFHEVTGDGGDDDNNDDDNGDDEDGESNFKTKDRT